ncbi:glycoside hydrolase family 15 [Candidatus Woesearchaeota archaeon]|nr:glycoside hydrolase family 15 [Candidatus Woesearchaeota archaeon]
MVNRSIAILESLQHPTGLFSASRKDVRTGYNLCWIRDTVYASLGFEAVKNIAAVKKAYHALLDLLLKHEYKIDWMIKQPVPKAAFRYIHARYDPLTLKEVWEEWGNKQNDAIGAVLFKIGDLENRGIKIIRSSTDVRILQKLVDYLGAIHYWHDKDNGMWEENEEIHASSIGACVAGLKAIAKVEGISVLQQLIRNGEEALNKLLPRESETKEVDLALLSLIYPYNIVAPQQRDAILRNVEKKLVRNKGVVRYAGDRYYSNGGVEAEWTFGFPWLAIIYKQLNNPEKHAFYSRKTLEAMNGNGEMPELYYGKTDKHNENTPLAWGQAMCIVAMQEGNQGYVIRWVQENQQVLRAQNRCGSDSWFFTNRDAPRGAG